MTPQNKAQKVFAEGQFDATGMLRALAEQNPQIFLKLVAEHPGVALQKSVSITPHQRDHAQAFLRNGNKVGAIKMIRAELGVGLKEAKDIVDKIQEEHFSLTLPQITKVKQDLHKGRYVWTIKEVRGITGLGLREAKQLVDNIKDSMPTI
jgi:ribosomal protein L7/L12